MVTKGVIMVTGGVFMVTGGVTMVTGGVTGRNKSSKLQPQLIKALFFFVLMSKYCFSPKFPS